LRIAGEKTVIEFDDVLSLNDFLSRATIDATAWNDVEMVTVAVVHDHHSDAGSLQQINGLVECETFVPFFFPHPTLLFFPLTSIFSCRKSKFPSLASSFVRRWERGFDRRAASSVAKYCLAIVFIALPPFA